MKFIVIDFLICHIFLSFSAFYGPISCIHCQMKMFYTETLLFYILHFNELGPCVCNKLKDMLPVLDFHEIWSTWGQILLKWYIGKYQNMLKSEFHLTEHKTYSRNIKVRDIKMNTHPLS